MINNSFDNRKYSVGGKRKRAILSIVSYVLAVIMILSLMPAKVSYAANGKSSAVNLANYSSYSPLQTGTYYVDRDITFAGYNRPGLCIASQADVVIYVKEGCTLTATGSDASRIDCGEFLGNLLYANYTTATPGIYLPYDAKLTFVGEGTVVAKGGNGDNPLKGASGGSGGYAWVNLPSWLGGAHEMSALKGSGGEGGTGADAPAPGIGGYPGTGGVGGEYHGNYIFGDGHNVKELETFKNSNVGKPGQKGGPGEPMGELYIADTIKLTATAGTRGTANVGIAEAGKSESNEVGSFWSVKGYVMGTGGGSGGSGGLSGESPSIGGGAGGGGGAGSGSQGISASTKKTSLVKCDAYGGKGTLGTATQGGNGGDGGSVTSSDGTLYVSKGGAGGAVGIGGQGGNVYVASTASINGKTGSVENIATGVTGPDNTAGNGKKASVSGLAKVYVTLKLNDVTDDSWLYSHTVTLRQNGEVKYTLRNEDIITGEVSSTYSTYIPAAQSYTVYVDGLCIGNVLNGSNTSCEVNAYTAAAKVSLDNEPYSSRKVFLYNHDIFKYSLPETAESGTYSLNIFKTVTGAETENTYDVYIDDMSTQKTLTIESIEGAKENFEFFNAQVTVLTDGAGTSEQSVSLVQGTDILCNLAETATPGVYSKILYCAPGYAPTYSVFINNENTGLSLVAETAEQMKGTVNFYAAQITLNKDGQLWTDASVAIINQNGTPSTTFLKGENGVYTGRLSKENGAYDLYIYGSGDTGDTGIDITEENAKHSLNYYSVYFDKNDNGPQIAATKVIKEGDVVTEPVKPYIQGRTFEKWCVDQAGTTAFDFVYTPINSTTTVYASWLSPSIFINTLIRCDANGNINSAGEYYKMSNLSITGYPRDGEKMSAIILDYENVEIESIDFSAVDGVAEVSIADKRAIIRFNNLINVLDAENYARALILKPVKDVDSPITVTVYGKTN